MLKHVNEVTLQNVYFVYDISLYWRRVKEKKIFFSWYPRQFVNFLQDMESGEKELILNYIAIFLRGRNESYDILFVFGFRDEKGYTSF